MNKTILFLGSGVYLDKMPNVNDITKALFEEEWHYKDGAIYEPGLNSNINYSDNITPQIKAFLTSLSKLSQLRSQSIINYEDLYSIIHQIINIEHYPTVYDFTVKLGLFTMMNIGDTQEKLYFNETLTKAIEFIECVIYEKLKKSRDIKKPVGFNLVNELQKKYGNFDIFTLNHDLLVENYLCSNNISFDDGFNNNEDGIISLDKHPFINTTDRIKLIKLHGSINWLYVEKKTNKNRFYQKDTDFNSKLRKLSNNQLIIGRDDKVFLYGGYLFSKLIFYFDYKLNNTQRIIMSGYGWNDLGINQKLFNWMDMDRENKIILLHENPEELKKSRSNLWYKYDDYIKQGRIIPIRKWLCNTKLGDISEYLK